VSKLAETGDTQASAAPVLFLQAAALARAGERKGAEAALSRAIELAPGFLSAHVFLGDVLARQARFTEALDAAQAAFAIEPSPAHALRLGAIAEQVGDVETAIEAYRQLIKALPDSHVGYNQLAWVLVSNELDLEEAEQLARIALKIAPQDGPSLDTLGWVLFQRGLVEEALPYLRQAYAVGGTSAPLVAYHLAQAEAMAGDQQRAVELYDLILGHGERAFVFSEEARLLRDAIN